MKFYKNFKLVNIYTHQETGNEWGIDKNKNVKNFVKLLILIL
jgi:hypothetical protein